MYYLLTYNRQVPNFVKFCSVRYRGHWLVIGSLRMLGTPLQESGIFVPVPIPVGTILTGTLNVVSTYRASLGMEKGKGLC